MIKNFQFTKKKKKKKKILIFFLLNTAHSREKIHLHLTK